MNNAAAPKEVVGLFIFLCSKLVESMCQVCQKRDPLWAIRLGSGISVEWEKLDGNRWRPVSLS
jgi:hypothetical protein